jgi:predicted nucleotidyltransferase
MSLGETPITSPNLMDFVIYRCVIGSRAYGLDNTESDVDTRGIYLPPADLQWSLYGVPDQLEFDETQECYWELQKFILLALKANPNILECLYTPLIETTTPLADELLAMREKFLSRLIYQTYNGYVASQFKKIQKDIENRGEVRWKHAMHLIRLLLSGITTLREGYLPLKVEKERERLLAIRNGGIAWEKVNHWRLSLHKEFEQAFQMTKLPDRPDYEAANQFLVHARRSMV